MVLQKKLISLRVVSGVTDNYSRHGILYYIIHLIFGYNIASLTRGHGDLIVVFKESSVAELSDGGNGPSETGPKQFPCPVKLTRVKRLIISEIFH